jgi:phosphonate transport system substrate-binding protein
MQRLIATFAILAYACLGNAAAQSSPETLSFGIVPQQAASKLARLWGPILADIGANSGTRLLFKTAPNIPEFEKRCAAGEYDIAYMNPYHYTVFQRAPGYQVFARQKDKRIRGIMVVRKDSPLHRLEQLSGATLAFPAPAAFAASLLPRAQLTRDGIAFTPKYVASHDSVYRTVAKGLYPAGGGIQRTFNNVAPEIREQLRVLWSTEAYTPHAIAAHPRVAAATLRRIQQAMLQMDQRPVGQSLLWRINFKGIQAAEDAEWDDIRGLGIDLLEKLIKG